MARQYLCVSMRGYVPAAGAWKTVWARLVDDALIFGVHELVQGNANWSNASHSNRLAFLHDRDHGFIESALDYFDGFAAAEEATRHEHARQRRAEDSGRLRVNHSRPSTVVRRQTLPRRSIVAGGSVV